jgi:Transposase DDE domain
LVEPLRAVGRDRAETTISPFLMLIHDWSKLSYSEGGKQDLLQLTNARDIGYELTTALLVSADDGSPLAPMELHCLTSNGVLSTRERVRAVGHLDQVLPTMTASRTWGLSKPLLHVIDREADSVGHYRCWHKAGHKFLIRADERLVRWNGKDCSLSTIRRDLGRGRHFQQAGETGEASYQGKPATLFIAEAEVVLYRDAKTKFDGKSVAVPGFPLTLRYILVQVRNDTGKILAEWMLLSNAPREWATTEQLARCYYWRWRIESFFKLLKSHGHQLEQWQQESGPAIARRMLVAAMACAVVWQLDHDNSPAAMKFKDALVRLSGRQMKKKKPHTTPALLAGLWVMLSMFALLEHTDIEELKEFAAPLSFSPTG